VNARSISAAGVALAAILALAGPAAAQEAPPARAEVLVAPDAPAPPPAEGPQWRAFSRGASSTFLIDPSSVRTEGDAITVKIARVPLTGAAGDYSHIIDDFAVRCASDESHLVASTEAYEDGELTETFPVDEPWAEIRPGSFDEGIQRIGCGVAIPTGAPFPSVRAYIDAGRP